MTRTKLIRFRLERFASENRKTDFSTLISFIENLLDDPNVELEKIRTDYLAFLVGRQAEEMQYKQQLEADVASLQGLDINSLTQKLL